jgi:hypothetical protein
LVNVENLSEEELKIIQKYYSGLSKLTKNEESLQQSHSIDDAANVNEIKKDREEDIIERLVDKKMNP